VVAAASGGERRHARTGLVIVPRWEWRTFGERFGDAEDGFAALTPESVHESDEMYLLSPAADESVKVRDGLLDIKHLERVNHDGLEQWKPVLKEGFPLSAEAVGVALTALGVPPPHPPSASTVEDLVSAGRGLVAVPVRKRRAHYMLGGCMAELTDVRTDTAATRTIAVEADDPARVIAAVRELGLGERPNVSFPRGLKTLLGLDAHRYAVLDVGTNSVKFHVGEHRADGSWSTVADRAEVTRLGEGLDETGSLQTEPMERTIAAIADMAEESRRDGAEEVAAVGTAGLRIAENSADFVAAVQDRCGVAIEVISGEEEGRLAYLAATSGLKLGHGRLAVFDTGGGSSQFTFGRGKEVGEQFSVNVGAARFTERFGLDGAVSEEALAEAFEAIGNDLARLDGRPTPDALVGMGGAATNLAAVKHELATYDSEVVQGTVLDLGEIDRQIELYRTSSAENRRRIAGLQPGRADVILAGACIVRTVIAKLGRESATVSDRGLRHGLLLERFG
jgi:exopolyphosphatase/guanosine-5'-triphosphate,3'-diphosphate pyrophosphatase